MTNLLSETRQAMSANSLQAEDVTFIGSERSGHCCTWDEYVRLADREYDAGFGGAEVAEDLLIVFKDGTFMERGEYDGSEWWEVRRPLRYACGTVAHHPPLQDRLRAGLSCYPEGVGGF